MLSATPLALQKLSEFILKRPNTAGVKIGIKTSGCSGFAYYMEFVSTPDPLDFKVLLAPDVAVYVPLKWKDNLNDLVIDYETTQFQSGFSFNNSQETGRCGCGESFSL